MARMTGREFLDMEGLRWTVRDWREEHSIHNKTYDSFSAACEAVEASGIHKCFVTLVSTSFGYGGSHRAVWSETRNMWVNPRQGCDYWGQSEYFDEEEEPLSTTLEVMHDDVCHL